MIVQGLVLTAIGLGAVFVFLFILVALMHNLEGMVSLLSRVFPGAEERKTETSRKAELAEIAAAVFIATRLSKQTQ